MPDRQTDFNYSFGSYFRNRAKLDPNHVLTIDDIGYYDRGSPNREPGWITGGRWIAYVRENGVGPTAMQDYASYYSSLRAISNIIPIGFLLDQLPAPATDAAEDDRAPINSALLATAYPYVGKKVSDLPDTITVHYGDPRDPTGPFGQLLPGVPNPGVDPDTGRTPIDDALGHVFNFGGFLGVLFSIQGLALLGAAILLYIGFKYVMNANSAPVS